jgi:8-oxo-dGTP diphosphatase / 2-hydroxy-dATP diphosphatase
MKKRLLTLCIPWQDKKVLLGFKKTGFGAGQWNSFGGKIETGETIEEATKRELKEESNIEAREISKMGILNFEFEEYPEILEVHIFQTDKFEGVPIETEEMKPQWFSVDKLPYNKMWSSDIHWMPLLLAGKKFKGTFLFDRPSTKDYSAKIIKQELTEVDKI